MNSTVDNGYYDYRNGLTYPIAGAVYTPTGDDPRYEPKQHTYKSMLFNGIPYFPGIFIEHFNTKDYSLRRINHNESTNKWTVKERDDGRIIEIGTFSINDAFVVNPKSPINYAAVKIKLNYEDEEYTLVIPENDYKKRNILQYLPFFKRNIDCPDKYVVCALYRAFQEYKDWKFLVTPERSGWEETEKGEMFFNSSLSIVPELEVYYPEDILERQLTSTLRSIYDIAKDYAEALPKIWQYKLLVAIRLVSLVLYFAAKFGVIPDQLYVVEVGSESAARMATALLKTQNYNSQVTLSLSATKTDVKVYIGKVNDGIALFSDNSYSEEWKKRDINVSLAIEHLHNKTGKENNSRHLTAIVAENPGNLNSEIPAMFIDISDVICAGDPDMIQKLSGEFDAAFIRAIETDTLNTRKCLENIINKNKPELNNAFSSENCNSKCLVRTGLDIAELFKLISPEERKEIIKWLKNDYESSSDSSTKIVNDVRDVLNSVLFSTVKVVSQHGEPYYDPDKIMAFADDEYINFENGVWKHLLIRMKTTKKRLKALRALDICKMIHKNNGFKRNLEVEVAPDVMKTVSVYSLSKKLLNTNNREKIDLSDKVKFLLEYSELERNKLLPLGITADGRYICKDISFGNKSNDSVIITGQNGRGKTFYATNMLASLAMLENRMLVCDVSDSFTRSETIRALPIEVVDALFEFINLADGKNKLPINPLFIGDCSGLPAKKRRIVGFIKSIAGKLDNEETKILTGIISDMLKEHPKVDAVTTEMLRNTLISSSNVGNHVYSLISSVLDDIDTIGFEEQSWGNFFEKSKRIPVLSFGNESGDNFHPLLDAMIASAFAWQRDHDTAPLSIVIDEIKDQNFAEGSPLHTILTQGRKYNTKFIGMTQHYISTTSHAIDVVKEAGIKIFFKPAKSLDRIAAELEYKSPADAGFGSMGIGDLILSSDCYNKFDEVNEHLVLHAKTVEFVKTSLYEKFKKEYGIA